MSEIKFGTDGWRGIIAEDYTFKNVAVVSQAIADYLGAGKKVAVGYDTRFMSGRFAETAAKVFRANKLKVILSDRSIPTPALSLAVRNRKLDLGIMITASHNPPEYNGYKIKLASGGAAGLEVTAKVEKLLGKSKVKEPENYQDALKVEDLTRDYVSFISAYIDKEKLKRKKFKVLVDVMYGSGNGFIARVLKGTNIQLDFIRNGLNPSFGGSRPEPVEENLEELKRMVRKGKYDLGIALDGDADRLAAVGEGGVFIHPQKIVGLLALHLNQDRGMSG
ncbi:phosphoglucomutase/phosphomannomutase family protein, partial [bacterium]